VATIEESERINGVMVVTLKPLGDDRGRFVETFRKEWFPQRDWGRLQGNASYSSEGVLRGLHYHHRQVDYWYLVSGRIRVGLHDLRTASPTRGNSQMLELDSASPQGLYIPVGVAHGFLSLTEIVLTYLVDNYYDGTDEHGVAWNDPDVGLDWGVTAPEMSARDAANRLLRDIPAEALPR
jgi:dTDP-4-dehydrorhamnose 3,5-epimerase